MFYNLNVQFQDQRVKGFYKDPKEEDSFFTLNMVTFQPNYAAFPPTT